MKACLFVMIDALDELNFCDTGGILQTLCGFFL